VSSKNLSIFKPINCFKLSKIWSGMFIPDPDLDLLLILDLRSRVKKAPDPGSGSGTLGAESQCYSCSLHFEKELKRVADNTSRRP
jgi:hypothetical protein